MLTPRAPARFWTSSPEELLTSLRASPTGLTDAQAAARLRAEGANAIGDRPRRDLADVAHRLTNPLILVLLVAAGMAGLTGDVASLAIITLVVAASIALDMVQEHRARASVEALRRSIALTTRVRRDGVWREIPVARLVRGDVVQLAAGDLVPADGLLLSAKALQVNQAAITGESFPVEKSAGRVDSAAMADATNALFQGSSVLSGTGDMLVVATGGATRFGGIATALQDVTPATAFERGVRRFGLVIVRVTMFLVLFVLATHLALGRPPLESFLFALALAVGLTPELLPMIMTISLARGAERMAASRVIVKRLSAIHDLGTMDVLCTDKTGTLTEAKIALVAHPAIDGVDSGRVRELAVVNAAFETGLKSPLDAALLDGGGPITGWTRIDERPFDFDRRRVSVLAERYGAGLRLLAIAVKAADGQDEIVDEAGFTLVGYCAFADPPKISASRAIADLGMAGVRVKVVSGDSPTVVRHVVAALGLQATELLSGDEIAGLSDAALAARVDTVDLYARVSPDQKTRIVRALIARGHTVGFLGDGINDAPAIRAADVGLSVDGATDIAREAADMILLAPDLEVVAAGVAEGRRTYANIMKYIRMGTSSNVGNMVTMALASLWLPFLPLTPVQVLLNNLIYDLSQAGLPFDRTDAADVGQPQGWDMHALICFTAIMAPLSSVFDLLTFAAMRHLFHLDPAAFRTGWFIESMATQILVVFVIRTRGPFWRSRPDPVMAGLLLGGLALAVALPLSPLAAGLGFGPLPLPVWACVSGLVLAYLAMAEGCKRPALSPVSPSPLRSG
ncbi:HAD-IC family P-type ATPase [Sphingomonas parapaucimobilis]|uniref:HAD-IC family P-type ATPase n=1 Tax=Sphingomonas parapaucimobilis TaxID=28213 RepID=UPI00391886BC